MPRSEYAKYFVRDAQGRYIGTEEEREWSEEELDRSFGRYWEWERVRWVLEGGWLVEEEKRR